MVRKDFYFDLETTGTNPEENGIHQIGYIIKIEGFVEEQGQIRCGVSAEEKIMPGALEVSKTTPDMLAEFQSPAEALVDLVRLLGRYVDKYDKRDKFTMIGYNAARFDVPFLRAWWERHEFHHHKRNAEYFGSYFNNWPVDPLPVLWWLRRAGRLKGLADFKLTTVCKFYGIELGEEAHDAVADIQATAILVRKLETEILKGVCQCENSQSV